MPGTLAELQYRLARAERLLDNPTEEEFLDYPYCEECDERLAADGRCCNPDCPLSEDGDE